MEIVLRSAAVFLFLWLLLRAMGKRELSELTAFELVLLVVLGDIVQQGVTQEDMSITGAIVTTSTFAVLVVATSYVSWRWPRSRPVLEGVPVVAIRDGEVFDEVLDREHLTIDELKEAARRNGIDDLSKVAWCILEPDGRFSFLRAGARDETPEDRSDDHRTTGH